MYTTQQLTNIFNRIGLVYDPDRAPDFELLREVQYACQRTVPYENLDILCGRALSLDYGDLYTKIVERHMGGYCFEINGFLGEVYRSLGCPVTDYMARYLRGEKDIPVRRHRVLAVTVGEKRYLCDAGIGQPAFRVPLLIEEGSVSEQYGETYRVTREPFLGWVVSDLHHGEWRRFYSFTEEEQLNIDYLMPSFWCEHSPESPFNKEEMFALKTDTGRITLDGRTLKIFDGEDVTVREVAAEELPSIYRNYFGLPFPVEMAKKYGLTPTISPQMAADRAVGLFFSGYNCAQSVFGAFADQPAVPTSRLRHNFSCKGEQPHEGEACTLRPMPQVGMSFEDAMKLSSSFGGGMGRLREVCGAVSGMFMVAGAVCGYGDTGEDGKKAAHYQRIQAMAEKFREKHGSLICRELIASLKKDTNPTPEKRTEQYYKERPCARFVRTAAEITAEMLAEME